MSFEHILLKDLNPAQREAVQTLDGPLLILAGAGSGKTRVLTHRIANLIAQHKARPEEIFAVTFTNKAAKEMEERTFKLLQQINVPIFSRLWISTFHSSCVRILRSHVTLLGYTQNFVIYDSSDQLSLIKKVVHALNIDDKKFPPKMFLEVISQQKMLGITPEQLDKTHLDQRTKTVYTEYEKSLIRANAMDFDDLLLKTVHLFQNHPEVLEQYQNRFKYILIDEYQDTNHIQYLLVKMLAAKHHNLCVVGDEDQSIYSWRGADIQNILGFEQDFSETKVIKLEENYRSTKNIVEAASALIQNNVIRKNKTLFTSNPQGDLITIREENNEYDEARFVVRTIQQLMHQSSLSYSDFSIFYRTNAQSRVLEEQLRTGGMPYKIVGGLKFYDRMEVKDVISYLKLLINPQDDIAFKRVINTPTRGIGKTTVEKIEDLATSRSITMMEAARIAVDNREFNSGTVKKVHGFLLMIEELQALVPTAKPSDLYVQLIEKTNYVGFLQGQGTIEADSRIENLSELDNAIKHFEEIHKDEATVVKFLEEIALVSDIDQVSDENGITLMTLHVSKGLEYPVVFIVGVEEGIFPGFRATNSGDSNDLEEERRIAYVGITRAREKLFLTHARMRKVWGEDQMNPPSRFINEIPRKYLEMTSAISQPSFIKRFQQEYGSRSDSGTSRLSDDYSQEMPSYESYEDDSSTSNHRFKKGVRVKHAIFGIGTIYQMDGSGDMQKVTVVFDNQQMKTLVLKFAKLAIV